MTIETAIRVYVRWIGVVFLAIQVPEASAGFKWLNEKLYLGGYSAGGRTGGTSSKNVVLPVNDGKHFYALWYQDDWSNMGGAGRRIYVNKFTDGYWVDEKNLGRSSSWSYQCGGEKVGRLIDSLTAIPLNNGFLAAWEEYSIDKGTCLSPYPPIKKLSSLFSTNSYSSNPTVSLITDQAERNSELQFIADDGEKINAVWGHQAGLESQVIQNSEYDSDNAWSEVVEISNQTEGYSTQPKLATGSNGDIFAFWSTKTNNSKWILQIAAKNNGLWGEAETVSQPVIEALEPLALRQTPNGLMLTWLNKSSDGSASVQASQWNGTSLSSIAATREADIKDAKAVISSAGLITAIWSEKIGDSSIIQHARFINGVWTDPISLGAGDSPAIVIDQMDNVTMAWGGKVVRYDDSKLGKVKTFAKSVANVALGVAQDGSVVVVWNIVDRISSRESEGGLYSMRGSYDASNLKSKIYKLKLTESTMTGGHIMRPSDHGCSQPSSNVCKYSEPEMVTLTAQPYEGYFLDKWVGCDRHIQKSGQCQVLVDKPVVNVRAIFKPIPPYLLTVTKTRGGKIYSDPNGMTCYASDIKCVSKFERGTEIKLFAEPKIGKSFSGWAGDCSSYGSSLTCRLIMDGSKTVGATFQ